MILVDFFGDRVNLIVFWLVSECVEEFFLFGNSEQVICVVFFDVVNDVMCFGFCFKWLRLLVLIFCLDDEVR